MIHPVISIIIFVIWLILTIFNHFHIISYWSNKKNTQVWWHRLEGCIRGLLLTHMILLHTGFSVILLYWLTVGLVIWWIFFDLGLNLKRGKIPFYVGENSFFDLKIRAITNTLNNLIKNKKIILQPSLTSMVLKFLFLFLSILLPLIFN